MIIIVALGNPGKKFDRTRHNAGFMALDIFAQENGFPEFAGSKKYASLISEKEDVLLAKPQTFMNESGRAVKEILKNTREAQLVVVHDDIDLPLGKIKFSKDSGAGGHKGVDSIISSLGNNNFVRLKIGIATGDQKAQEVVLQKFTPEQQEIMEDSLKKAAQGLAYLIENGLEKTMNTYN